MATHPQICSTALPTSLTCPVQCISTVPRSLYLLYVAHRSEPHNVPSRKHSATQEAIPAVQLDCLQHTQKVRKRTATLTKKNWKIEFKWVKAHAGIYGNEIADRLAKEATQNDHATYSRIPKSDILTLWCRNYFFLNFSTPVYKM